MQNKNNKTERFKNISPGMFIHWRVYSVPGFGEWRIFMRKISPPEDVNTYTCCFAAARFSPKNWAHRFEDAIMKYMVLTAQNTITALDKYFLIGGILNIVRSLPAMHRSVSERVFRIRSREKRPLLFSISWAN